MYLHLFIYITHVWTNFEANFLFGGISSIRKFAVRNVSTTLQRVILIAGWLQLPHKSSQGPPYHTSYTFGQGTQKEHRSQGIGFV